MTNHLSVALRFLAQGIAVIPAANDGTKRPAIEWKKYQSQLPTPDEVMAWFGTGSYGIGVLTGAVSGNLEMLELEGRAVAQKMHIEIAEIANNSGLGSLWSRLNAGYVEVTPSGGLHWLYRVSDGAIGGNTKLACKPGENGGVDVWAETRSEGGFTITAPSAGGVHPSGGAWQLIGGRIESIPLITLSERASLHQLFALFDGMPKREDVSVAITEKHDGPLTAGDDYNARHNWHEILEPLGWKAIYTKGEATVWRRPGKSEGISATTNYGGNDKFYVFSTSTAFTAHSSYNKFAVFAITSHNGSYRQAAEDLRARGYGTLATRNELNTFNPPQEFANTDGSSWKPVELKDYFDGLFQAPQASILRRSDGNGLIYPGRVHSIYGESESGKSWVAQIATAELLRNDKKVIYIDFESDAHEIVNRLKGLKVSRANLLQYLTYIRPDGARDVADPYWLDILEPARADLVIIDGVTESLTMWGGETKDNDAITRWMRIFPRTVAAASGAAVVLIDHITKNADTRGRFAIGGQAKLATIDGAAYLVEPIEPLAPGRTGVLTMRVTKDRPGQVRRIAGMWRKSDRTQEAAVFTIDSTRPLMEYVIGVPKNEDQVAADVLDAKNHELVDFIHTHGGATMGQLHHGVKGSKDTVRERLMELIEQGLVENRGSEKTFILYVTAEGEMAFDLKDATVTHLTLKT